MAIRVQENDFDIGAEIKALTRDRTEIGGVASFVGLVRDFIVPGEDQDATAIRGMTLEHYPGMTERQLGKLEAEARGRWELIDVLIIHRYGTLEPGDRIVMVATTAAHRETAIEACHFLIDWLKTKAPFWKLETTPAGERWVEAKDGDTVAEERWIIPSRTLQNTD